MHDLNDMLYFARVIEEGGFSAAARTLGIPKSTLSRRVSRLEEELGVRLIHRSTRSLTLTDIGREFMHHCESAIAAAEAARDAVAQAQRSPRGRVRMTAPMDVSRTLLARALPEFMTGCSEVVVELEATNRRVNLVDEGIDVALRVRPTIEDSSLVVRPFAISPAVLVAAPALIASLGTPSHPRDLADWPSLSLAFADGRHRWKLHGPDGDTITIAHTPRLITDDMSVLRDAAVAGVGLVSLPAFVGYPAVQEGLLDVVLPDWTLPHGRMHIVYPHRRGLLPAVRHLVDFLAGRLPGIAEELGVTCTAQVQRSS
ncbi:MAG TPA: LysR substrate-binding domain-containing protein [Xanthomonadaceae bacterium]|nr:LysR substrate-binding domain-containing protein [Xanthomonadaceae bacterium]